MPVSGFISGDQPHTFGCRPCLCPRMADPACQHVTAAWQKMVNHVNLKLPPATCYIHCCFCSGKNISLHEKRGVVRDREKERERREDDEGGSILHLGAEQKVCFSSKRTAQLMMLHAHQTVKESFEVRVCMCVCVCAGWTRWPSRCVGGTKSWQTETMGIYFKEDTLMHKHTYMDTIFHYMFVRSNFFLTNI